MNTQKTEFCYYKLQLSVTTHYKTFDLFNPALESDEIEKIKTNKNTTFAGVIKSNAFRLYKKKGNKLLPHKVLFSDDNIILLRIGNKKNVTIEDTEFKPQKMEHYPNVLVAIENTPESQLLIVEKNSSAFQTTQEVVTILADGINKFMPQTSLRAVINPMIEEKEFWDLLNLYRNRITNIKFDIVINQSNIRSALKEELKTLMTETGTASSKVELNAAEDSVLKNIDENNPQLSDLAQLTQAGQTNMSIKVKGISNRVHTKSHVKLIQVDSIEGANEAEIVNIIKAIFSK